MLAAPDHWHEIYGSFFRNEENGATGTGIARLRGYGIWGICLGIVVWCRLRISCGIPLSQHGKSGVVPSTLLLGFLRDGIRWGSEKEKQIAFWLPRMLYYV